MTYKLTVYGLVQGVGFRPFVKRLADSMKLSGQVRNSGGVVGIEFNGNQDVAEAFIDRLCLSTPKGARISHIETEIVKECSFDGFRIAESDEDCHDGFAYIPPDIATCAECEKELFDKNNRRYKHPFISCVNCGPRYSILTGLPYDRADTVMRDYVLCDKCAGEYSDITDRRCHAQTIACNECGPVLSIGMDEAVRCIKAGRILAVKDIGGYHFACDAQNADSVGRLREIKQREAKPFAVMFSDVKAVREYAKVSETEEELLLSEARPIVLLDKINEPAANVCGDVNTIGAMLPCNPIQLMLSKECGPLVMTSGNISGEPIITDDEVIRELAAKTGMAVLSHDRPIVNALDDSIVRVVADHVQMVRRARGYVPAPIVIPELDMQDTIAYGGDLKASYALGRGSMVIMSQHFGDLENMEARRAYADSMERMIGLYNMNPVVRICDMHPDYYSAKLAAGAVSVQHHAAHVLSVAAEHSITDDFTGIAFDGTGYGPDGCIWGGEVFVSDRNKLRRRLHLRNITVVGGEQAAKDAALLLKSYEVFCNINEADEAHGIIRKALEQRINTFTTSSMGRLFDAVSAALGVCSFNRYEGECAMRLEAAAAEAVSAYPLSFDIVGDEIVWEKCFREIVSASKKGVSIREIALGFHRAVADMIIDAAKLCGHRKVLLSGGVFLNRIITGEVQKLGAALGYDIYINEQVPANDGGIALGQLWYEKRGMELCV